MCGRARKSKSSTQSAQRKVRTRILLRHGYGVVRGSSSRGAVKALAEMIRRQRQGLDTVFTIDGPRFIAKPGSVQLAKATGASILCFHAAVRPAFVFRKSWDLAEFPLLFSRAAMFLAPPIAVSRDADRAEQARKLQEVQSTLDQLRARAKQQQEN